MPGKKKKNEKIIIKIMMKKSGLLETPLIFYPATSGRGFRLFFIIFIFFFF